MPNDSDDAKACIAALTKDLKRCCALAWNSRESRARSMCPTQSKRNTIVIFWAVWATTDYDGRRRTNGTDGPRTTTDDDGRTDRGRRRRRTGRTDGQKTTTDDDGRTGRTDGQRTTMTDGTRRGGRTDRRRRRTTQFYTMFTPYLIP